MVLRPVKTKSFLDLNQIVVAGAKESTTSFAAWKCNAKRIGAIGHPCCTPVDGSKQTSSSPTKTLTTRSEWIFKKSLSFGGGGFQIYLVPPSIARNTVKSLTRSMKTAQVPRPCSWRFCEAILTAKIPSQQPQWRMNPFYSSETFCFQNIYLDSIGQDRAVTLTGDSISMIPRHLFLVGASVYWTADPHHILLFFVWT